MNSQKMASGAAEGISVRPSLREIEALRAMVATGKTTQAARDLGTSQPSVSRAIASLEARLGQPLFMRRNGRLAPTAEALAFEARAAVIFDLLDQLAAPRAGIDAVTTIRFATPPTLANLFLAPILARFIASEPRVRVQVEIGKSTDCLAAVAEGSADLGLVDQTPSHDGVRLEVFRRARPHALLPKRHRLASRPELAIGDLVGERILALSRRFSLRTKLDAAFAAQRAEPLIVAEATTSVFLAEMVRAGLGIAVLNPFPLELRPDKALVFRPLDLKISLETAVVVPARGSLAPAARALANFIRAEQPASPFSTPVK
ncbi:LysR family transcriptional regulator [Afipia sp. GAS231]|uniref:LysR family transcriptional regulator n=1 Tax=Afipia sp. GAS231 TaxID=1882747 RepID=UPI0015615E73|nr:LysR substrate-binding domain-containing protein [Afipia sp. GAS231]